MGWPKALSDEDERRLVVDHEDGFKIVELKDRYGISESTVYRILSDYNAMRTLGNKHRKRRQKRAGGKGRALKPCGTNAAYARHISKGERACLPCIDAHAATQKSWHNSRKVWRK